MKMIKKPKLFISCGISWMLIWGFIFIIVFINLIQDKYFLGIFGLLIVFIIHSFGLYLFLLGVNWGIIINDDNLIFIDMFRQKKEYTLNDLSISLKNSKFNNGGKIYIWYKNKKISSVNLYYENYTEISKLKWHE